MNKLFYILFSATTEKTSELGRVALYQEMVTNKKSYSSIDKHTLINEGSGNNYVLIDCNVKITE